MIFFENFVMPILLPIIFFFMVKITQGIFNQVEKNTIELSSETEIESIEKQFNLYRLALSLFLKVSVVASVIVLIWNIIKF